jgi:L-ascorbate metabolism protein UlaG (beta-lactamase superfamily)
MSVSLTWHGHGTFSLDIDGTKVVIDPFFAGNNPAAKTAVSDIPADFILQTHGHMDHIADTLPLATRTGAMIISNFEIEAWFHKQEYTNTHSMNTGGSYTFPFGKVKMTAALHSSGLPDGSYGGDPGGFVVEAGGKRIYFAGDTAVFSDMALIGAMGLDVAVLPIGDNYTMGPDDALLALGYLKPKTVIPGHYNTWPVIAADAAAWAERVKAETAVNPIISAIDEAVTL